jgi:hypothetical protein
MANKDILKKIYPFGFTDYDRTTYREFTKRILGIDPFKNLPASNIPIASHLSLISTIDCKSTPRETLSKEPGMTDAWSHVFLNFIGSCDSIRTVADICTLRVRCHFTENRIEDCFLILLSGTMHDWYYSILSGIDSFERKESLQIICACCLHIESIGFPDLFKNYNKIIKNDGIFKLTRKK